MSIPAPANWLDFTCYASGALDDDEEVRAVEAQVATCEICLDELLEAARSRRCSRRQPPRDASSSGPAGTRGRHAAPLVLGPLLRRQCRYAASQTRIRLSAECSAQAPELAGKVPPHSTFR